MKKLSKLKTIAKKKAVIKARNKRSAKRSVAKRLSLSIFSNSFKLAKSSIKFDSPLIWIVSGILFLSLGIFFFVKNSGYFAPPPVHIQEVQNPLSPNRIKIPSAEIDLDVEPGAIKDGEWVLTDKSAYFLPKQFMAEDQKSNLIIYAHKRDGLFINLSKVKEGDSVSLTDNSGKTHLYNVIKSTVVDPNDLGSLRSENGSNLTLITCDGIFDTRRLIVKAVKKDGV